MADFNLPALTDSYTNVLTYLKNRDLDILMGLDPATTTPANVPNNTIRWNSAGNKWEKLVSGAWQAMASRYAIDVATVMGYAPGNASGNIPLSNGTLNTNLNADMVDGAHAGTGANQVLLLDGGGKVPAGNLPVSGVTAGTYRSVTVGADGRVTGGTNPTTLAGYGITDAASIGGNSGNSFNVNTLVAYGAVKSQYFTGSVNGIQAGDVAAVRTGGTTGVIFLCADGSKYLYWDGSYYQTPGADLKINGCVAWHAGNLNPYTYGTQRLLRSDAAPDAYNVQSWWDGTYWQLKGYNGTTYHAGVRVAQADNANALGGLGLQGAGSAPPANAVLRSDANGCTWTGWLNTVSGDMGAGAVGSGGRVYCSNDAYLRYKTMANFGAEITGYLGQVSSASNADSLGGQPASYYASAANAASHGQQKFTASGNFTVPDGVTTVYLTGCGGGGGGGEGTSSYTGGGGGGGACAIETAVSVTPGQSYTVTVGGAGAAAGGGQQPGGAGGTTSFGSLLSLPGGGGGGAGTTTNNGATGSPGGWGAQSVNSLFGLGAGSTNIQPTGYGAGGFGAKGQPGAGTPGFLVVRW